MSSTWTHGFWKSGRDDAQTGKGPQNTNGMPWRAREQYDAGYKSGKR